MPKVIKGFKEHRHDSNPLEKQLHDSFIDPHVNRDMDMIVFPPADNSDGMFANDVLSEREQQIVISTIQWLGSSVGQYFLHENGFKR